MGKCRQGLIDLGATTQRTVLFNLAQKIYPANRPLQEIIRYVSIFSQVLLYSRWSKCPLYGQMETGA